MMRKELDWLAPSITRRFGPYWMTADSLLIKHTFVFRKFSISASIIHGKRKRRHASLIFRVIR